MYEIRGLEIQYPDKIILKSTSISFKRGRIYILKGESGIGKTSLLNSIGMISNLNKNVEFFLDGSKVSHISEIDKSNFITEEVSFIFQNQNLIRDITIFDNLVIPLKYTNFGRNIIENKIDTILKELEISDLKYKYPTELSGGEEQRVAIARAILCDKTIILADEPTNSLDKANRCKIYELLKKLAYSHNKIVVVATHDDELIEMADTIITFENQNLIINDISENVEIESYQTKINNEKIKINDKQLRLNKKKQPLHKFIIFIVAVIVSLSVISINFNRLFDKKYKDLLNSSLENGIIVINDSFDINPKKVIQDLKGISLENIEEIKNDSNDLQVKPYIEFLSHAPTLDNLSVFDDAVQNSEFEINSKKITINKLFSIQPIFNTNLAQANIQYYDRAKSEGIFISQRLINELKLDNIVAGSTIKIKFFIPIRSYDVKIEKDGNQYIGDGELYTAYEDTFYVLGIVKTDYPFDYSSFGNTLFMDVDFMQKLQQKMMNKTTMPESINGFKLNEWTASAVHVKYENSLKIPSEINRIKKISSEFEVISSHDRYSNFNQSVEYVQNFLIGLSIVLLILIISILFFIFYLTNNARKLEVGILKALGLRRKSIFKIYCKELVHYGIKMAQFSSICIVVASLLLLYMFQLDLNDIIHFIIYSIVYSIIISMIVSIFSGMLPIYFVTKETVVDVLRLNRK